MPIIIGLEFTCDVCGVTLRMPFVPGIVEVPASVQTNVPRIPPGWTLTPEAQALCPTHKPQQLVTPVASLQDLGFKVHEGGKAR